MLDHRYALTGDAMRDERQWWIGLIGDDDRLTERVLASLDACPVTSENGRQRLPVLDPVTRSGRDHESDARVDHIVHLRSPTPQCDDATSNRAGLHAGYEAAARSAEQLALGRLRKDRWIVDNPWVPALR